MRRQIAKSAAKMKGNWWTFGRAMAVRFMFAGHAVLAIHTATAVTKSAEYWYLAGIIGVLFVEATVTLIKNQGHEYRYFCPSIFIYTCAVVPPVWITEIAMMRDRLERAVEGETRECYRYVMGGNHTPTTSVHAQLDSHSSNTTDGNYNFMGQSIDIHAWMQILEQLFLLLLIMGRWMMPKGKLTHNQLSQLLLVYLGDAADMVEFFDAFNEPVVRCTEVVSYLVLTFWSLSLSQFSLVIAEKEEKKRRSLSNITNLTLAVRGKERSKYLRWIPWKCTLDVTRITLSITLQDGPYLVLRMLLIFYYRLLTYTNLFFTAKNTLVIVLMIYRLLVVQTTKTGDSTELENRFCMISGGDFSSVEMSSMYYDPPWATASAATQRKKRINTISAPLIARFAGSRHSLAQSAAIRRDGSESSVSLASRQTCTTLPSDRPERPKSRLLSLNFLGLERKKSTPRRKDLDAADAVVQNLNKLLEQKPTPPPNTNTNEENPQTPATAPPANASPSTPASPLNPPANLCPASPNSPQRKAKTSRAKDGTVPKHTSLKWSDADHPNETQNGSLVPSASDKDLAEQTVPTPATPALPHVALDTGETNGNGSRPRLFLKRAYDQRATNDTNYVEPTLVVVDGKNAQRDATPQLQRHATPQDAAPIRKSSLGFGPSAPIVDVAE